MKEINYFVGNIVFIFMIINQLHPVYHITRRRAENLFLGKGKIRLIIKLELTKATKYKYMYVLYSFL